MSNANALQKNYNRISVTAIKIEIFFFLLKTFHFTLRYYKNENKKNALILTNWTLNNYVQSACEHLVVTLFLLERKYCVDGELLQDLNPQRVVPKHPSSNNYSN